MAKKNLNIQAEALTEQEALSKPLGYVFNSLDGKGFGVVHQGRVEYSPHFSMAIQLAKKLKKSL